jgi:hypothetical protein
MRQLLMSVVVVGCVGCGGPLLYAGAEAESICMTKQGQTLPGTGALTDITIEGEIEDDFDIDLGDFTEFLDEERANLDARLDLLSFDIKMQKQAFEGIQELRVRLVPPAGSSLAPIDLVSYLKSDPVPADAQGLVEIEDTQDSTNVHVDFQALKQSIYDYLDAERFSVKVVARGALPQDEWQADIRLCTAADVEFDYGRKLGVTK